jgi:hypothetical protein
VNEYRFEFDIVVPLQRTYRGTKLVVRSKKGVIRREDVEAAISAACGAFKSIEQFADLLHEKLGGHQTLTVRAGLFETVCTRGS